MAVIKFICLLLITASLVVAAVCSFMIWHSLDVTAVMPDPSEPYTIEALALNVTILEIVIAMVGFALAALGLFGYNGIKNAAINKAVEAAEDEAKQTVSEQIAKLDAARQATDSGPPEHPGRYEVDEQSVAGASPAGDE